jgi:predicted HicB family RNase H-like nuclease
MTKRATENVAIPKKRGRPYTGEDNRDPVFSLRMPPEIRDRAEARAKKDGVALSKAILHVLEKHLPKRGRE